jgi:hypothetical protein
MKRTPHLAYQGIHGSAKHPYAVIGANLRRISRIARTTRATKEKLIIDETKADGCIRAIRERIY